MQANPTCFTRDLLVVNGLVLDLLSGGYLLNLKCEDYEKNHRNMKTRTAITGHF